MLNHSLSFTGVFTLIMYHEAMKKEKKEEKKNAEIHLVT